MAGTGRKSYRYVFYFATLRAEALLTMSSQVSWCTEENPLGAVS